jgi:hypothetical protein
MRLTILCLCFIIGFTLIFSSCQKEQPLTDRANDMVASKASTNANTDTKYNTFYGPQEQVGEGHARTFFTVSHSGIPQEIGVIFTDEALSGLPSVNTIYPLEFHNKALEATLFEHVALGLSAGGHGLPPSGRIGPHMDVRFFMMTQEERLAIPAPPAPGFDVAPPPGYLPANYALNAAVAQIGRHWGENIFTAGTTVNHTMIYGTWNGKLTFINPIVTLTTLASGQSYSVNYPQPQFFAKHGYYPTRYNIYEDDKGRHYVTLSDFVWR